ncbi:hypothetical protein N7492_010591 [Penicillium capsulatum]|uniref:EthD domain-containing protein n=1 Tax=Penicillium capsulatum TaxID=69766 RepID=A0A9W9HQ03_9EURO|nr:hypothetical protein N7492_010591 [Penicillium capsulatum]KAJ6113090.1 hypothetical protein N7512_008414 [Penicillium capsulatum]
MVFHAAVMYPEEPGLTFDESYYLQTHMPLVDRVWKKHGLQSWKIIKYTKAMDGSPAKFRISAALVWESEEALRKALADPETPSVFEDIPNFTNVSPITLAGVSL